MCLVLVAWRGREHYPCVIAANRDELYTRPTLPAQWWDTEPQILAGRDLEAGGTWLGVTRSGCFAALTNYRDPEQRRSGTPSRGALVTTILKSGAGITESLDYLRGVAASYNAFNLIFSDGRRLAVFESTLGQGRELKPGIYGLSNHLLDTPWPKVQNAKSRLSQALMDLADPSPVLALLRDDRPAPDDKLPRTGISVQWERMMSSAFVRTKEYGTRCSTLVRIDQSRRACFDEWTWDSTGAEIGVRSLQFDLE
jgi:uncharacterized protein with NRDE domain